MAADVGRHVAHCVADFNPVRIPHTRIVDSTITDVVPVTAVRKMRWTYSADFQPASYVRSEFEVAITNWSVTGTNLTYKVAGPGSRRIDDNDTSALTYSGDWTTATGNFYGATIHETVKHGASFTCRYNTPLAHSLYLGTRYTNVGAVISVTVDGHTLDRSH